MHQALPPFAATSGPHDAKIMLVGEAHGESEQIAKKPFAGESGKELWRMIGEAFIGIAPELHAEICAEHKYGLAWLKRREDWLAEASMMLTNVFAFRPTTSSNKIDALCCSKKELSNDYPPLPAIERGLYVRPDYLSEVARLFGEISLVKPNLIVCLGNVACWAILRATAIGSIRGTISLSWDGKSKVLPTYHPAGVMRNWSWRPIVVADLMKAAREMKFPEIRRPERQITINPTIDELQRWACKVLYEGNKPPLMAVDTETECGQIKCIGFAISRSEAMVVPLFDSRGHCWSEYDESRVWAVIEDLLESDIPKLWQNGLYDLQYILKYGIRPKNNLHDTMLLHHSIFPEMNKGLGFLGSIYSNEPAWKLMRKRKKEAEKRDE